MDKNLLKKYAMLAVNTGVNIKKDNILVITSPIETAEFARLIAKEAYNFGAKEVIVHYSDQQLTKIKLENSSLETISDYPSWMAEGYNYYARQGACFISIAASDPDGLKGVSVEKIGESQKARTTALKEYYDNSMSNKCRWCVLSVPTLSWAKKVFPNLSDEKALESLWDVIFKTVRVDTKDPIKAWENHNAYLEEKIKFMNENNFKSVHLKSSNGTDLNIELPEGHIWAGGSEEDVKGIPFNANMPTEEIFTLPKKTGVNGIVYSSKPLSYGGNLIDNFSITFKDGRAIDFTAETGYDILKQMLESDEGAKYLGEVAFVPYNSPISNSKLIFFNTLFDENAACHLAFGRAYESCVKNADKYSEEELEKMGVNNSVIHVDFMIGTSDLEITGINKNGETIKIFSNGNWAF
ncbi:aminopeptidase [Clostridium sp.]|uniref:aminopeptidase n=1 Tax=Clostridium sp. TaxID=1506 RepID=UPI0025C138A7|nr:aminopeptidase [Clostridium sp.]MCI9302758.1 aminopeptidase [Clostridium sp.]